MRRIRKVKEEETGKRRREVVGGCGGRMRKEGREGGRKGVREEGREGEGIARLDTWPSKSPRFCKKNANTYV